MAKAHPEWCKVGVELIDMVWTDKPPVKIVKLLANGNVRIEGSDEQHRVTAWGGIDRVNSGRNSRGYRLKTPELMEEIAAKKRREANRALLYQEGERITRLARENDPEIMALEAARIRAKETTG